MQPKSQAELESQLEQRWAQVRSDQLSLEQAFGILEDWVIQLGERKAFLHPNLKQWMWYDRLHDEWNFAGIGVGEGILLTFGGTGGVKKLPKPGVVAGWCVYRQNQEMHGPLKIEELRNKLESDQVSRGILIWSTRASDWFAVDDQKGQGIIFA
jgi:hypothetical protein